MPLMKSMMSKQADKLRGGYDFLYGTVFTWDGAVGTLSSSGKKYNFTEKTWHHDIPPVIGAKGHYHIFGMNMNHGLSKRYEIAILIPIGWIVGTGFVFVKALEIWARP